MVLIVEGLKAYFRVKLDLDKSNCECRCPRVVPVGYTCGKYLSR